MINTKKKTSFTVFIPCFGECRYLDETISSLLDQDYDIEIVLCPQGNTDVSNVLTKYPKIKSIRLEKPSLYKARIFLFDKSTSDYIYFVDDDDIVPKGLFAYMDSIIKETNQLDLYRIPLKEFTDNSDYKISRNQLYSHSYSIENKETFLIKCFDGTYHNGVVHLFIKNCLKPKWFDVDVFQTEDRLITFSVVNSIKSDICVINDAFYLYRKYQFSHSRTLDYLKGRDDFITVNNCLGQFMSDDDLVFNSGSIIIKIISYLKVLWNEKRFTKNNFLNAYSNKDLENYLKLFRNNKKIFKQYYGSFAFLIVKTLYGKNYLITKLLIIFKCKYEFLMYGSIQFN